MKKRNKKSEKEVFCDISFFMKQSGRGGCNGCPRSRKCEEWSKAKDKIQKSKNSSR